MPFPQIKKTYLKLIFVIFFTIYINKVISTIKSTLITSIVAVCHKHMYIIVYLKYVQKIYHIQIINKPSKKRLFIAIF